MREDVIAFVPLRSGSKGIIDKNIKEINGKPLFFWSIVALLDAEVPRVVISTDSSEYAELVKEQFSSQVEVIFRSKEVSTDEASTESVVLEFLTHNNISTDSLLLLVQATSPLLTVDNIKEFIQMYDSHIYSSLLSVVDLSDRFFWDGFGCTRNYSYKKRQRRQMIDDEMTGMFLVENGAMYLNSVKNWLKDECRLSESIGEYWMSKDSLLELDSEDDWKIVEKILEVKYGI